MLHDVFSRRSVAFGRGSGCHRNLLGAILLMVFVVVCPGPSWAEEDRSKPIRTNVVVPRVVCEIASTPEIVVEGGTLEVAIRCVLPPGRPLTRLNCEIKSPSRPEVLMAHRRMVEGLATHTFTFRVPPRSEAGILQVFAWLGTDWRDPVVPIASSKPITVATEAELARRRKAQDDAPKLLERYGYRRGDSGTVALLAGDWVGQDERVIGAIEQTLIDREMVVTTIDAASLTNPFVVTPDRFDLLILTGVGHLPTEAAGMLNRYLAVGGNLMVLGAPLWSDPVARIGGRWLTATQMRAELAKTKPAQVLLDFEDVDLKAWSHAAGEPKSKTTYTTAAGGADGTGKALHVRIPNLAGWDTVYTPPLGENAIDPKHQLTCFWAKGGPDTPRLAVEWNEQDGSRWIATVPLTTSWQYYVLTPDRFAYWRDSPTKNRGGVGDAFNLAKAKRIGFGLASTHTGHLSGKHAYWVDQVGTGPSPWGRAREPGRPEFRPVDLLWPSYKFYEASDVAGIRPHSMQALIGTLPLPRPSSIRCPHQRPQGTGYNKDRPWRMITVAEALGPKGEFRGPALAVTLDRTTAGRMHAVAAVGSDDTAFLATNRVRQALGDVAARIIDGAFLLEGGSEFYTVFQGESIRLGARVVSVRRSGSRDVGVRIRVLAGGAEVFGKVFAGRVDPGAEPTVFECTWWPDRLSPKGYTVVVDLLRNGRVVDRLMHELGVWEPKPKPSFVTAREGHFWLDGKTYVPFGVNHMPSSGIGTERSRVFEQYLGKQAYDPEIFDRELARIKDLGMNMVSEFLYHRSHDGRNLIDLLRRCRKYGLKVNLSLRPGTPMDFRWDEVKEMILENRLAENDTVFAYDLAWEPFVGNHAERRRWDGAWRTWIKKRYRSLAAAERAWDFKAPRDEKGQVINPLDKHCGGDGPWAKMVADYRRFIDELAHKHYAKARQLVRTVDKRHLVSFRMTVAGDPTYNQAHRMPFDFRSLTDAVDIFEPEGYGRIGDWQRVRPGMFTSTYARSVDATKPVMWAEYGVSTWNMDRMEATDSGLAFQARFFEDFLRMVDKSDANGAVCWWYPGGFRVGENSDFGIVNPDGTDRPVAAVLRQYAKILTKPREIPKPDVWLEYDADDPAGIFGIYKQVKDTYWQAIDKGKTPGLKPKKK